MACIHALAMPLRAARQWAQDALPRLGLGRLQIEFIAPRSAGRVGIPARRNRACDNHTRPRPTRPRRGVPMDRYARSHLTDPTLLHQAEKHLAQDRGATAELLA